MKHKLLITIVAALSLTAPATVTGKTVQANIIRSNRPKHSFNYFKNGEPLF